MRLQRATNPDRERRGFEVSSTDDVNARPSTEGNTSEDEAGGRQFVIRVLGALITAPREIFVILAN
jgi:hypothetical protein